jgi:DNA mismatch endonuclease (patch repair protein)
MDIWNKEKRSEVMSKIRSRNTKPEMSLRKALFARGLHFRANDKKLPGKPDIVLPKYKAIIFVHGCFWHGHRNCKYAHTPKTNTEFWVDKITSNCKRDKINIRKLVALGWNVIIVWECEIRHEYKRDIMPLIDRIMANLFVDPFDYLKKLSAKLSKERESKIMLISGNMVEYQLEF